MQSGGVHYSIFSTYVPAVLLFADHNRYTCGWQPWDGDRNNNIITFKKYYYFFHHPLLAHNASQSEKYQESNGTESILHASRSFQNVPECISFGQVLLRDSYNVSLLDNNGNVSCGLPERSSTKVLR